LSACADGSPCRGRLSEAGRSKDVRTYECTGHAPFAWPSARYILIIMLGGARLGTPGGENTLQDIEGVVMGSSLITKPRLIDWLAVGRTATPTSLWVPGTSTLDLQPISIEPDGGQGHASIPVQRRSRAVSYPRRPARHTLVLSRIAVR
jgi:hypothetical protein